MKNKRKIRTLVFIIFTFIVASTTTMQLQALADDTIITNADSKVENKDKIDSINLKGVANCVTDIVGCTTDSYRNMIWEVYKLEVKADLGVMKLAIDFQLPNFIMDRVRSISDSIYHVINNIGLPALFLGISIIIGLISILTYRKASGYRTIIISLFISSLVVLLGTHQYFLTNSLPIFAKNVAIGIINEDAQKHTFNPNKEATNISDIKNKNSINYVNFSTNIDGMTSSVDVSSLRESIINTFVSSIADSINGTDGAPADARIALTAAYILGMQIPIFLSLGLLFSIVVFTVCLGFESLRGVILSTIGILPFYSTRIQLTNWIANIMRLTFGIVLSLVLYALLFNIEGAILQNQKDNLWVCLFLLNVLAVIGFVVIRKAQKRMRKNKTIFRERTHNRMSNSGLSSKINKVSRTAAVAAGIGEVIASNKKDSSSKEKIKKHTRRIRTFARVSRYIVDPKSMFKAKNIKHSTKGIKNLIRKIRSFRKK